MINPKPNIIFIHILKCGGTSMLHMLYKEYGVSLFHPVPISTSTWTVQYPHLRGVTALEWQTQVNLETVNHYGCIAGHYDWGLADRLPQWQVVTILRDPVEQIRSLYQYMVASANEVPEAGWMEEIGFETWVQSNHAQMYLNGQTRYLSGHRVKNVNLAIRNLREQRVVFGLLEQFEESVRRWNEHFGWSLDIEHHNKAKESLKVSEEIRLMVEQLQSDDMKLYQVACDLFKETR